MPYSYRVLIFSRFGSIFSHPTIKPSNVVVDAVSMSLMKGSLIDFATELIGSSFRVAENPQVRVQTRSSGTTDQPIR